MEEGFIYSLISAEGEVIVIAIHSYIDKAYKR